MAIDVRNEQQSASIATFRKLGFTEVEAKRRFQLADKSRALSLRYVAWLAEQPFMSDFAEEIKQALSEGKMMPTLRLFTLATSHISRQYRDLKEGRHEYDLSVDWENEEYKNKKELMKTLMLLCFHLLLDQDVTNLVKAQQDPTNNTKA